MRAFQLPSTPPAPFETTVMPDRDEVAVVARGGIDMATAPVVRRDVADLEAAGFRHIVIDLHEVDFIDSAGLRMLLELRSDLEGGGGLLTLVPPQPSAERILEITDTRHLFDWRDRFSS